MTKTYHLNEPKESPWLKVIGWVIAPFITGWIFVWYNYVIIQLSINYWQWCCISIVVVMMPKWLRIPITGLIGATALLCQVLKWLSLITLPLIHLH